MKLSFAFLLFVLKSEQENSKECVEKISCIIIRNYILFFNICSNI